MHVRSPKRKDGPVETTPYLFVYGGTTDERFSSPETFCLDLDSLLWRKVWISAVPPARDRPAVAAFNGYALVFGGKQNPEGIRRGDLWVLDLERADFTTDGMPSQKTSIAGAELREIRVPNGPPGRDSSPFCRMDDVVFLYGGRTGFAGTPVEDVWAFAGSWDRIDAKGAGPGPRAEHALLAAGAQHIAVIGGVDADGKHVSLAAFFLLDLVFAYWSSPHVGGDVPRPSRGSALSTFADGWAVVFGGDPLGSIYETQHSPPGLVVLHAPDSGPPPPPTNDAEALATKASGVSLHMGPEMALEDAEALLLKSKKEVLRLEVQLHNTRKDKQKLLADLENVEQDLRRNRSDLGEKAERLRSALAEADLERKLAATLQQLVAVQADQLSAAARLEHRYRSTVASGESLRILTDEFVRDSVVADELNEKKEWKKTRNKHNAQLLALQEITETSEKKDRKHQQKAAECEQLVQQLLPSRDDLRDLRVGGLPAPPGDEDY